eukprot:TRINITY_DN12484_c2_g4_i3.p1 TRINITY_DN12484_c2_g4~~TRINITY_DN12484_c2_g4_i3.p1  ORF type:complete len:927 (+),score=234.85 TRINITY_DN12484_c2_g4_i3:103-2883(+)
MSDKSISAKTKKSGSHPGANADKNDGSNSKKVKPTPGSGKPQDGSKEPPRVAKPTTSKEKPSQSKANGRRKPKSKAKPTADAESAKPAPTEADKTSPVAEVKEAAAPAAKENSRQNKQRQRKSKGKRSSTPTTAGDFADADTHDHAAVFRTAVAKAANSRADDSSAASSEAVNDTAPSTAAQCLDTLAKRLRALNKRLNKANELSAKLDQNPGMELEAEQLEQIRNRPQLQHSVQELLTVQSRCQGLMEREEAAEAQRRAKDQADLEDRRRQDKELTRDVVAKMLQLFQVVRAFDSKQLTVSPATSQVLAKLSAMINVSSKRPGQLPKATQATVAHLDGYSSAPEDLSAHSAYLIDLLWTNKAVDKWTPPPPAPATPTPKPTPTSTSTSTPDKNGSTSRATKGKAADANAAASSAAPASEPSVVDAQPSSKAVDDASETAAVKEQPAAAASDKEKGKRGGKRKSKRKASKGRDSKQADMTNSQAESIATVTAEDETDKNVEEDKPEVVESVVKLPPSLQAVELDAVSTGFSFGTDISPVVDAGKSPVETQGDTDLFTLPSMDVDPNPTAATTADAEQLRQLDPAIMEAPSKTSDANATTAERSTSDQRQHLTDLMQGTSNHSSRVDLSLEEQRLSLTEHRQADESNAPAASTEQSVPEQDVTPINYFSFKPSEPDAAALEHSHADFAAHRPADGFGNGRDDDHDDATFRRRPFAAEEDEVVPDGDRRDTSAPGSYHPRAMQASDYGNAQAQAPYTNINPRYYSQVPSGQPVHSEPSQASFQEQAYETTQPQQMRSGDADVDGDGEGMSDDERDQPLGNGPPNMAYPPGMAGPYGDGMQGPYDPTQRPGPHMMPPMDPYTQQMMFHQFQLFMMSNMNGQSPFRPPSNHGPPNQAPSPFPPPGNGPPMQAPYGAYGPSNGTRAQKPQQ